MLDIIKIERSRNTCEPSQVERDMQVIEIITIAVVYEPQNSELLMMNKFELPDVKVLCEWRKVNENPL